MAERVTQTVSGDIGSAPVSDGCLPTAWGRPLPGVARDDTRIPCDDAAATHAFKLVVAQVLSRDFLFLWCFGHRKPPQIPRTAGRLPGRVASTYAASAAIAAITAIARVAVGVSA